jgi:6,7-dimethyl-8-ribityllumazine synthase
MAQTSYSTADVARTPNAKIAIIMSKWYRELSDSMVRRCLPILEQAGCAPVEVHVVPGCLEIPLAARRLHQAKPDIEALIVFGIIVRGDTYHFDMVKDLALSGLERVMFERDVPIINEILPVDKIEHAQDRCADNDKNKGIEAALAAVEIIEWRRRHPVS